MKHDDSLPADTDRAELRTLLQMIGAGDWRRVFQLLKKSPALARAAVKDGATRQDPCNYVLREISHYVYGGDTALHIAAAGYDQKIAEKLISCGANVEARNRRGAEPLHYAADGTPGAPSWNPKAQYRIVEFLIESGANPNSEDKSGVAPLHRAVRTRCTAAVRALLANGADARQRNGSGSTPLHLAVQNTGRGGSGSEAACKEQANIIRMLLDGGASPADKDVNGRAVKDWVRAQWVGKLLGGE